MNIHNRFREALMYLVAGIGILAAIWSASMLVGGFFASGQLDSTWNPLGSGVAYAAAFAIIAATAAFYYVIGSRQQTPLLVLLLAGGIVAILTIFASLTQTYLVVDGSLGDNFVRGTAARVTTAWQQTRRVDEAMVETYQRQIGHYRQRMEEEEKTGRGPRFRAARQAYNHLRETYGGVLGSSERISQQGRSITDDAGALAGYIADLRGKVVVFDRFSQEVGITTENHTKRLNEIAQSLQGLSDGNWIDRKTLVYREVIKRLGEMIESVGLADLGFTLAVLLSFTPDLIQILCTALLLFLRPKESPFEDDGSGWSPSDKVWGENVR